MISLLSTDATASIDWERIACPILAESGPSNLYISPDLNDRYW